MANNKNGIANVDTQQMETMRAQVVEQELSARSWKAYYEKMYYSMEAEKIEQAYQEYRVRMQARLEKEKAAQEEFIAKMKEELSKATGPQSDLGKLTIGDVKDGETDDEPKQAPVIHM